MRKFQKTLLITLRLHQQQLYFLIGIINFLALLVFVFVSIGVYGSVFMQVSDGYVLLKLFLTATALAVCVYLLGLGIFLLEEILANKASLNRKIKFTTVGMGLMAVLLASCGQSVLVMGKMIDAQTGLKIDYKRMQPEAALLVMNEESINHNDIPLGEQFTLINKNVKGLVEREGKVSVGCALTITDTSGKVLLRVDDLFKDKPTFPVADAKHLKCIVSTGSPMKWDEHYKVKVHFWDRWGKGEITNELTIFTNGELSQE